MPVYMSFDECLKRILSILDMSINRLAKAINVDNSLVNRWVNGKRIPAYNTPYIDSITEYVARNIRNSFQSQQIDRLYAVVCDSYGFEHPIKEKIRKILQEAQGYSIECKKQEKVKNKENTNSSRRSSPEITGKDKTIIDLSPEDKIIMGTENILSVVADLLNAVSEQPPKNKNNIYIDYNCDLDLPDYLEELMTRCVTILSKAINNGWKVYLMIKLSSNTDRTIKLIKLTLPLLTGGRFFPYYKKTYDNNSTSRQCVIIPGIGAVSCLTSGLGCESSYAFLFRSCIAIDIFERHFKEQLSAFSQPLFEYFNPGDFLSFNNYLAGFEDNIGNRFFFKNGFTDLMLTENTYKKLLSRNNLLNHEFLMAAELFNRQRKGFLTNVINYQYWDICLSDSVENLIKRRQLSFYGCKGVEAVDMEVCDIAEYFRNAITLLETYNKYNIALIPKSAYFIRDIYNLNCMVKERQAVVMTAEPSSRMQAVRLYTEEPTVVNALYKLFKDAWEHIAPVNKDKKEIIRWLQYQLNLIESPF